MALSRHLRLAFGLVLGLSVVTCGADGSNDLDAITLPDAALPDVDSGSDSDSEDGVGDSAETGDDGAGTEDAVELPDLVDPDATAPDGSHEDVAPDLSTDAEDGQPGEDTAEDCRLTHGAGARFPVGDNCNFCACGDDGIATCTTRACDHTQNQCEYGGTTYSLGERFDADDDCNVCVCAASGLACTRRCPELPEQGAILLESLDASCGDDPEFTGAAVLAGLPTSDVTGPFVYDRERDLYPETRADTTARLRITREDSGFIVCRLPTPTQPAIDMEVVIEFMTEDGAFNEGFHTYLRRNNFGFLDAWTSAVGIPEDRLDGTYDPACPDHRGFAFAATLHNDGEILSDILKVCDISIAIEVGRLETRVAR